jgi:transcriptional regulator with XRE-family HTH domain
MSIKPDARKEPALRAFLSLPLTGLEGDARGYVLCLSRLIEHICEEQGFELYVPHRFFDPIKHPNVPSSTVHFEDLRALMDSDVVIAYMGKPSHGVGYENRAAFQGCKPAILLIETDRSMTRMIKGDFAAKFIIEYREPDDLERSLGELLRELRPKLLAQRAFLLEMREEARILGRRMREARERRGMSRQHLADLIGVNTECVKALEEEFYVVNPSWVLLYKAAHILGVPPSYLVDPSITEDQLRGLEISRTVSEFCHEYNVPFRDYELLLAIARRLPKGSSIDKGQLRSLYHRLKHYRGEENG